MKMSRLVLGSSLAALVMAGSAAAAPVTYIFSGSGAGTLDGTSFSDFTVTLEGDTSNITTSGGVGAEFNNIVSSAIVSAGGTSDAFTGAFNEVVVNTAQPALIGFEQVQPAPTYAVAEGLGNSSLASYDLSTSFPLTTGSVSFSPSTYDTANGAFVLNSLSSLSFQASVSAAPEPSTWALMIAGLGIAGAMLRLGRRRTVAAVA